MQLLVLTHSVTRCLEEGSDLELDDINFDDLVVSHNSHCDEKTECSMIRKISQTSDISDSPLNLSPPPMRNLVELRNLSLLSMASSLGGLCVECDRLEGDLYASRAGEEKLESQLMAEREKNTRLERQLEKELMNSLRKQQKLEQDFDFHKHMVVSDCGRHIEELQEEHRESLRIIERRMSMEQREVIFASSEFKKMKLEVAQARMEKRDLQYENTQLKIQLKARKAPKHIKIGGEFVTQNQNKSIPGSFTSLLNHSCHFNWILSKRYFSAKLKAFTIWRRTLSTKRWNIDPSTNVEHLLRDTEYGWSTTKTTVFGTFSRLKSSFPPFH